MTPTTSTRSRVRSGWHRWRSPPAPLQRDRGARRPPDIRCAGVARPDPVEEIGQDGPGYGPDAARVAPGVERCRSRSDRGKHCSGPPPPTRLPDRSVRDGGDRGHHIRRDAPTPRAQRREQLVSTSPQYLPAPGVGPQQRAHHRGTRAAEAEVTPEGPSTSPSVRAVGWLSRLDLRVPTGAGGPRSTRPGGAVPGIEARLAWPSARCHRLTHGTLSWGCGRCRLGLTRFSLPGRSLLVLDGPGVLVTTLKPAELGTAVVAPCSTRPTPRST